MGRMAHPEPALELEPQRFEAIDLVAQPEQIHHRPVPDQTALAGMKHPRGHAVEHQRLVATQDAMAGVGTALISGNDVGLVAKGIDDLPLALITPLGTHDDGARHALPPHEKPAGR